MYTCARAVQTWLSIHCSHEYYAGLDFFLKNIGKCWFSETKSFYRHVLSFTCIWLEMFSGVGQEFGWQENTNLSRGTMQWPRQGHKRERGVQSPLPSAHLAARPGPPLCAWGNSFLTLLALHKEAVLGMSIIKAIVKLDFWVWFCFCFWVGFFFGWYKNKFWDSESSERKFSTSYLWILVFAFGGYLGDPIFAMGLHI